MRGSRSLFYYFAARWFGGPAKPTKEERVNAELRVRSAELGVREATLELQLALRDRRRLGE